MKTVLSCGVSGQDRANKSAVTPVNLGYAVCGTLRDAQMSSEFTDEIASPCQTWLATSSMLAAMITKA